MRYGEAAPRTRLVLVEDSAEFRASLLGWTTRHHDLEVVAALATAEEALAAIWEQRPDVVVMDLALPGMSGLDAVRALRRVGAPTPVVVLTLHDSLVARQEVFAAGANAFLPKHAVACDLYEVLCSIADVGVGDRGARLEAAERDQRLSAAATVTAGLTHEINNALQVVLNQLSVLSEELGPYWPAPSELPRARAALEDSLTAARHIAAVVGDVQALLRAERRTTRVIPREAVERALRLVRARATGIRLSIDLDDVPTVWGSEAAITQITLNLVLNALAACRSWTRSGHVHVELVRDGGNVTLTVQDDGPGIDDALLAEIWRPLHSSLGGCGLGLPIARHLVATMGGAIDVDCGAGRGTTFRVRLPVASDDLERASD
jgi:signal transduction histidine kinase